MGIISRAIRDMFEEVKMREDEYHYTITCPFVETMSTKFQLVDLAGSESDKEPGAEGKLLKEAIAINRGLHTLGKVIRAAAAKQTSIPLRESKLTRLLQDVIGVQPTVSWWRACRLLTAPSSLIETAKTLDFADNGE
ncbi:kinesin-like protein KIN-1, partial [Hyalella azteca]|uniref:Kinesin-like protein KIN-1 n=1 Tax=Hyalella azteca TaxID=294128 RepID=A0A8B7NZL2_HYAAZ